MDHRTTDQFWCEYRKLPPEMQRRADNKFSLLKSDPHHRSLQFKKIGVRHGQDIWSVRVTLSIRALAIKRAYGMLWFWIGNHETYETLIS